MFGKVTCRINFAVIAAILLFAQALAAQTPELDLAQKQIDANDLSAAAATLESYLKEHPTSAAAWIKRGNVADSARDNHTALADYDRAEKNGVPPTLLTYRCARSYMSLENNEAALAQLELAITNGVSRPQTRRQDLRSPTLHPSLQDHPRAKRSHPPSLRRLSPSRLRLLGRRLDRHHEKWPQGRRQLDQTHPQ
jgi:tetratricopeptide (TPR) repeat protein